MWVAVDDEVVSQLERERALGGKENSNPSFSLTHILVKFVGPSEKFMSGSRDAGAGDTIEIQSCRVRACSAAG